MKASRLLTGLVMIVAFCAAVGAQAADDIVDTAVKAGDFKILAELLGRAGLVETLKGDGPFTVFAPTDAAFRKLPKGLLDDLKKPAARDKLVGILTYHVVPARVPLSEALKAGSAKTVQGNPVQIRFADGAVRINDARLLSADIGGSNGVIHVIDSVLVPAEPERDPLVVIDQAIDRGVPLFNQGDAAACADIYMNAAQELTENAKLEAPLRKALAGILQAAKQEHAPKQRAWILRHGLNMVRGELHGQRM